jgi:uncharacterized membrane protein
MKYLSKTFLTGLITILPIVLTLYLVYVLIVSMESALGTVLRQLLPEHWYLPGMGVVTGLLTVLAIGILMHAYVVRWFFSQAEGLVYHVPVIKNIYGSIRDFFDYFAPSREREFEQVVAVTLADTGMEAIGFVTQALPERLPEGLGNGDSVLVYLPMSYMIGGYTLLVPRSAVRPLDIGMEEALRFTLTGGVAVGPHGREK